MMAITTDHSISVTARENGDAETSCMGMLKFWWMGLRINRMSCLADSRQNKPE
jgi:hypothetical protein